MDSTTGVAAALTAPLPEAEVQSIPQPRWSLATRIAFRFTFAYFVLYMLPFPSEWIRLPGHDSENFIERWYARAGHFAVPWIGKHVLHLSKDITVFPNGSGDTTYNWVAVLCFAVLAAIAALVWSLLDRRRANYQKPWAWFRIALRVWLGAYLALYGLFKVYPAQFPPPYLARYLERYGDSSPMGILWTMMGASRAYSAFAGAVELSGGVLLFVPPLATLGALIAVAAMANVFAMNMAYDVPVKLFSFHLMLAGIIIAAPDLRRLCEAVISDRAVSARTQVQLVNRAWIARAVIAAQFVFAAYVLVYLAIGAHKQSAAYAELAQKTPNYGIWQVDDFVLDGKLRLPLTTDGERWQDVVIQGPGGAVIVPMDGRLDRCQAKVDDAKNTMEITSAQPKWSAQLTYARDGDKLTLEGTREGKPVKVTLHRIEPQFLLKTRGFHWLNEFPFNR